MNAKKRWRWRLWGLGVNFTGNLIHFSCLLLHLDGWFRIPLIPAFLRRILLFYFFKLRNTMGNSYCLQRYVCNRKFNILSNILNWKIWRIKVSWGGEWKTLKMLSFNHFYDWCRYSSTFIFSIDVIMGKIICLHKINGAFHWFEWIIRFSVKPR